MKAFYSELLIHATCRNLDEVAVVLEHLKAQMDQRLRDKPSEVPLTENKRSRTTPSKHGCLMRAENVKRGRKVQCVCARTCVRACVRACVCVCVCVGGNTFRLWFTRLMAELFSMMFKVGVFLAVCN